MMNLLLLAMVCAAAEQAGSSFRVEAEPRLDPVFGDIASLRRSVDRSIVLEAEMQSVANQFSKAVHDTLALIAKAELPRSRSEAKAAENDSACLPATAAAYERARAAGVRYLGLGRELDRHIRDIRVADGYGDTIGLTPDYRRKLERSRRQHDELLRGFREMEAVFHDQLANEMRIAGCTMASSGAADFPSAGAEASGTVDAGAEVVPGFPPAAAAAPTAPKAGAPAPAATSSSASPAATMASIEIDSTNCAEDSRVTVDGNDLGTASGGGRTVVRLSQGPHEICVLPASDARICGQPSTERRAYVHDGLVLQVRCGK